MTTRLETISFIKKYGPRRSAARSKPGRFHRHVGRVFRLTKQRMQAFDRLQSLDPDTRQKVRGPLRTHLIRFIAVEERSFASLEPAVWGVWLSFVLLLFGAPLLVNHYFRSAHSFLAWVAVYFVYWMLLGGMLLVAFWPALQGIQLRSRSLKRRLISFLQAYAWISAVSILYLLLGVHLLPQIRARQAGALVQLVLAALLTYFFLVVAVILIIAITLTILYLDKRRTNARHPHRVVIVGLFHALSLVEQQPGKWTDLDFKRDLMRRLERIALCIEHDLPRRLRSGDDGTDGWLDKTALSMATALRAKKKLILTPGLGARERLLESLRSCFVHAATDNWDGLEKVEAEQVPKKQFLFQALDVLQTLIRGAMPLVILWVVQKTPLAMQDKAADTAMLAALGWLALSLLFKIDPLSKDKLDALKQAREVLKA